ncbi:PHO85 [Blepharisma stoltei]|uniref:Cyclin-dependent kinase 2 homolog n=1 Tax=Blepharisma stoltei TaxID=1481888 RepID=A0AAU9IRJ0_9CILI|nr:unnamed protein product [Blepharisma stoltei]
MRKLTFENNPRLSIRNHLDNYEKLEKIGEGTYSSVYKAIDTNSDQFVALKKIRLSDGEEGIPSTTIREISLLKDLIHPNIVKLLDVIHDNHKLYLVFEYVDHDLKMILDTYLGQGFDLFEAKSYLYQLLKGLAACHADKILHRDLKPQNILINNEGVLKLADFGLARTFGIPYSTYSQDVVTLWYRPPDILMGNKKYTTTIDMWSVGCIFAEMLRGKPLFAGNTNNDQLKKIFMVFGTPNENTWPGVSRFPEFRKSFPKYQGIDLRSLVPKIDDNGFELLTAMLQMIPSNRITSQQALSHPFFNDIPSELRNMRQRQSFN